MIETGIPACPSVTMHGMHRRTTLRLMIAIAVATSIGAAPGLAFLLLAIGDDPAYAFVQLREFGPMGFARDYAAALIPIGIGTLAGALAAIVLWFRRSNDPTTVLRLVRKGGWIGAGLFSSVCALAA